LREKAIYGRKQAQSFKKTNNQFQFKK
jgi:hypothetical protein